MRVKTLKTTALLTLSVLAAIACKKDEETTALPALDGSVSIIGLEEFMSAASEKTRTLKLKPAGASHPEGGELGYCWKISPLMEKYDTTRYANGLDKSGKPSDGSFEYVLKDIFFILSFIFRTRHTQFLHLFFIKTAVYIVFIEHLAKMPQKPNRNILYNTVHIFQLRVWL